MNLFEKLVYYIACPFFAISFILLPLTNDARIYLGVARLTDFFGTFPQNLDSAWEIKPIGNRFINYALYHIAAPFGDVLLPYVVRAVVLAIVVLICWYVSNQLQAKYSFGLLFLSMTTCANFCMLQAEYYAVLMSLLCVGLLLSKNIWCNRLAGFFMIWISLCKGITAFMFFPIGASIVLLDPEWRYKIKTFAMWCLIFGACYFVLCLSIFPNSIPDMLISKSIAHVGAYSIDSLLLSFAVEGSKTYLYIPIILIGVLALLWGIIKKFNPWVVMLWGVPIIAIIIQSEFFIYHYLILVLPCVVSIVIYERDYGKV